MKNKNIDEITDESNYMEVEVDQNNKVDWKDSKSGGDPRILRSQGTKYL